jgi:pimeloyl-ACP methyl ester carboxylesterase/predicted glycosyltransferase
LTAPPARRERAREQSRARYPDTEGFVERDGVRVFYEVYGEGEKTIVLLPTWSIVHSRVWKAQIPYLARHMRVVTFDGRGNGRSDRPEGVAPYLEREFAADTLAVMDATGTESAVLAGLSCGALWGTIVAADHPDRVDGVVYIGPAVGFAPGHADRQVFSFDEEYDTGEGWAKYNSHYWLRDYEGFLEFFFAKCLPEPHSTKQIEDAVGWALDTDPATLADTSRAIGLCSVERFADVCARVRCPTLVIHGDDDLIRPLRQGAALAEHTGGRLVIFEGSGHLPNARDPVRVNLLLRDFVDPPPAASTWRRARTRPKRALYVSSPIGLGHARRDLAIANELRELHPDLEIDWLAQHPVTAALEERGERIHPASTQLASESAHFQAESAGHELNAFQAMRRMDEIFVSNFMVFHDVVRDEPYDLWIGDEAWDVDYFLHENPELKTAPYVWLSDFVGYLPMPDGGEREAFLTADYNAEMIEQIARNPRVRDRALFVGEPDDIVPTAFGPGLPDIRAWSEEHFSFPGYVLGFEPEDREKLRAELGYGDERVCVVTVGGSGVGGDLLRRVIESKRLLPEVRLIVVAGPRIDLPEQDGIEVRAYVPDLHRHLAACDVAIVQGGLTTGMELVANGRPFLSVPLRNHFEQNIHVRHRLERYGARWFLDFESDGPEEIARAVEDALETPVEYLRVDTGGAARAAAAIAELL